MSGALTVNDFIRKWHAVELKERSAAQEHFLAHDIAAADEKEFRNQYPAYAADSAGETCKALDALRTDPVHRERYRDFVIAMAYGERPGFDVALASVVAMAEKSIRREGNGTQ